MSALVAKLGSALAWIAETLGLYKKPFTLKKDGPELGEIEFCSLLHKWQAVVAFP